MANLAGRAADPLEIQGFSTGYPTPFLDPLKELALTERPVQNPREKTDAKKAAVLGADPRRPNRLRFLVMLGCLAVVVASAFLFLGRQGGDTPAIAATLVSANDAAEVFLPAASFDDGKARFYTLEDRGVSIRYYGVKDADGTIRTAFDACDACWAAGKGYKQEGGVMVCVNCNQRFAISEIGKVRGGCNPAPLPAQVKNGQLVLRVSDIQAGRPYFDFLKGGLK
jgi:uncharacterized membrane protein